MPIEIVGRDEEVASVRAFVEGAAEGSAAFVLKGEAGVGKSTVWLAGVEHARAKGVQTLVSRPAEAERGLAHVALGDLLGDVADDVLPALPPPRRRALEIALLRADRVDETVDERALAVATLTALELLARDQPVLLAIDDVQWLDDWLPLGATPNFPEYPSAHACHSGAVIKALQSFFGADRVPFSLDSRITHATRHYARLHDAVDDVDLGRVLVGFHFRSSDFTGSNLGRRVGRYVVEHYFQPTS